MPSTGLHSSRSFKLGNPVFNRHHRAPPIHSLLNSSGESTGGSSEASSIDDSLSSSGFVEEVLGRRSLVKSRALNDERRQRRLSLSSISSLSDGGKDGDEEDDDDSFGSVKTQRSSSVRRKSQQKENRIVSGSNSPYQVILNAMDTDPKWRSERTLGRMVGMYKICGEIGSGNFAKVRLGVHQLTKEKVAVKIIDKTRVEPKLEKMLHREVSCMESLYHPNIVRLYEVIETTGKLYLISEWAPAGDLYSKVTLRARLSETEAKPIFRQILSALTYMHSNGIIHRDLKAENIFFSTGTHCKVGDFGFSTTGMKGQMLSTFCGSPPYAAPELFRDESYEGGPVDIWALGVLLYFMIEGVLPFVGTSIPSLKKAILLGHYEVSPNVSLDCQDVLQGILQQRPYSRMTLSQLIRHPWLQQIQTSRSTSTLAESLRSPGPDTQSFDEDSPGRIQQRQRQQIIHHELIRRQDTTQMLLPATKNRALSKTIPTKEQVLYGLVSPPEIKALEILEEIGITDNVIEAHRQRGVRSHVVGIYRIILHKIQEGRGINTKQFFYTPGASSNSLGSKPTGLPVPTSGFSSISSSGSGRSMRSSGGGGGFRSTGPMRKQFAINNYGDHIQQSSTCSIL